MHNKQFQSLIPFAFKMISNQRMKESIQTRGQDTDRAYDTGDQNIAALPTTKQHDIHSKTNTYTQNNYS